MSGLWALVSIASLALVLWAIIDLIRRPAGALRPGRKVMWIIGMLAGLYFFGLLGAAIAAVYLWGPRQRLNARSY